jgi:hypothetical protein
MTFDCTPPALIRSLKQAAIGSVAGSASLSISVPLEASLTIGPDFESLTSAGFLAVVYGLKSVDAAGFAGFVFLSGLPPS